MSEEQQLDVREMLVCVQVACGCAANFCHRVCVLCFYCACASQTNALAKTELRIPPEPPRCFQNPVQIQTSKFRRLELLLTTAVASLQHDRMKKSHSPVAVATAGRNVGVDPQTSIKARGASGAVESASGPF